MAPTPGGDVRPPYGGSLDDLMDRLRPTEEWAHLFGQDDPQPEKPAPTTATPKAVREMPARARLDWANAEAARKQRHSRKPKGGADVG